jgi:diadenosine tetraphosphate (Ap4A) HIT family hydrolase
MPTPIHQKVRLAQEGKLANAIIRLKSGWVLLGDVQPLEGYCVLLSDPVAKDLNSLSEAERASYLLDTIRVGDALMKVLSSYRINYETWCNQDPALHTHITPRYLDEPTEQRKKTPREAYDWSKARAFDPAGDQDLIRKLHAALLPFAAK